MRKFIIAIYVLTTLLFIKCANDNNETVKHHKSVKIDSIFQTRSIIDSRDGERYATVTIGRQTWMAENLRYNAPGSRLNPNNPSSAYGRLYNAKVAQVICPEGWHLASDAEWNELEMTLGMNAADTSKTGWRGTHGTHLKSIAGWQSKLKGSNKSGFNALPAGYYFDGSLGGKIGMDGLGYSVGFWASEKDGISWQRWLAAPLEGVNRQADNLSNNHASACRCVKD